MIVCAIDDLLFSIKISTAAKQLGVTVYFERMRDRVLPTVREKQPSLVIFDLNSSRLDPMEAIAALKADPELPDRENAGLRLARGYRTPSRRHAQAGIDQVLARSAFVAQLGDDSAVRVDALTASAAEPNHQASTATTSMMAAITTTRPTLVDEVCASSSSSPATPSWSSTAIDARNSPANADGTLIAARPDSARRAFSTTASSSFGTFGLDALGADAPRCIGRRVVSISYRIAPTE